MGSSLLERMQLPKSTLATVETIVRKTPPVVVSISRRAVFRVQVQIPCSARERRGIIVFHDSRLKPTAASCVVQVSVVRIP